MKLMIASDLHGSGYYVKKLMDRFQEEQPEKLLLLGDLLYHGPRNRPAPGLQLPLRGGAAQRHQGQHHRRSGQLRLRGGPDGPGLPHDGGLRPAHLGWAPALRHPRPPVG